MANKSSWQIIGELKAEIVSLQATAKRQDAEIDRLRIERRELQAVRANAIDLTRLSQSEMFDLVQAALAHLDRENLAKVKRLVIVAQENRERKW